MSDYNKLKYCLNRDYLKKQSLEYYYKNRDSILEKNKTEENIKKRKLYNRQYYIKNIAPIKKAHTLKKKKEWKKNDFIHLKKKDDNTIDIIKLTFD